MQTHVIKLCCQGCGSDLEVDENVRFLTCNYCQSKLEVVRDVSVTHTRVLEKLERTTDRIAGNLKVIELQNDLERMDREWAAAREGMMVRDKNGRVSEPSQAASLFGGVVAILGGLFFTVATASMGAPGFMTVFGIVIAGVGFFNLVNGSAKASDFQALQERHEAARQQLINRIEEERER